MLLFLRCAFLGGAVVFLIAACSDRARPHPGGAQQASVQAVLAPILKPTLVRILDHDSSAFVQGLIYVRNNLYESTGLVGHSSLRRLNATTGVAEKIVPIGEVFSEGLALIDSELVMLTWKDQSALVYDLRSLSYKRSMQYQGEGWGLTTNGNEFIMSDGSDLLTIRNSRFERVRTIAVTYNGKPLNNLNELEYARGKVYANVWYSTSIVEIDPKSGSVEKVFDCSNLIALSGAVDEGSVLNGIAYDALANLFYCTGKNWRHIFVVTFP